jgi:hypothetical protein
MDLSTISPLLAILSCLAGAFTGLLIFVLSHVLLSTYCPCLRSKRQERPNQRQGDEEMEVWARFTADADADAGAGAGAGAEGPLPELEPDTDEEHGTGGNWL